MTEPVVADLLDRSNRLGADRRITNFAGGNTSAKGTAVDPVTGDDVELLWVKGSGGDLGTLTDAGLAVLRLDRLRALVDVYPGVDREDEMVDALDHCLHGRGGAAPSIDTPLHALIDAAHVDHLHPDSMIALAAAADGERLVAECYGGEIGWLDWKRPGFELGLALRDLQRSSPGIRGAMLGGHGMICWAESSDECEVLSLRVVETAERFLAERSGPAPMGAARDGYGALGGEARRRVASELAPAVRGVASRDRRMVASFTDAPVVLEFLASAAAPRLASLGTSCPDHFLRTKVKPLLLDLPADAPTEERTAALAVSYTHLRAHET